jgi:hypothetical protein
MNASRLFGDLIRALTGQRRERCLQRRSAKPAIGTRIVLLDAGMRMTLPAGLSDALWVWLLDAGWRVERYRPDRRQYREVPRSQVEQLLAFDPAVRAGSTDHDRALAGPPAWDFPVSRRKVRTVRTCRQSADGVRFVKSSELQEDRASRASPPAR